MFLHRKRDYRGRRVSLFGVGMFPGGALSLTLVVETFNTPGGGIWSAPGNLSGTVVVEGWGGGGGGGADDSGARGGGGGGGGGYFKLNAFAATKSADYDYVIGAGGPGGTGDSDGTNGLNTTFESTIGVAAGGYQGLSGVNLGLAGEGGHVGDCVGDVVFAGGNGADSNNPVGGGGGGGADSGGVGDNATEGSGPPFRPAGGGQGGDGGSFDQDGFDGGSGGAGAGGGGGGAGLGAANGGDGQNGRITFTYYTS